MKKQKSKSSKGYTQKKWKQDLASLKELSKISSKKHTSSDKQ